MKKILLVLNCCISSLLFMECDPLGKEDLSAISTKDVFTLSNIAEAYVNNIHANLLPVFVTRDGTMTDEALDCFREANIDILLNGTLSIDSYDYYPYWIIRDINFFLDGIDKATFASSIANRLKGECLFWRAWTYFAMVRVYGGVPLVLTAESPNDIEKITLPRSKTSDCFAQIFKDIDASISLLPDPCNNARIDKAVAYALKGIVSLYLASPQFNRSGNGELWQKAYEVNKEADNYLKSVGKALNDDYAGIWKNEMNKEVIMVRRYAYPEASNGFIQVALQPLKYSESGAAGGNMPSLELVNAYPKKDGSKWDPSKESYNTLFLNRDERFYATIAYNGAPPYLKPMFGKENLWTYFYDDDDNPVTPMVRADAMQGYESRSSFYSVKMLDPNLDAVNKFDGQVDWVIIRYAEVIMNLAEAANEVGHTDEAIEILKLIRHRAGISPGVDGRYGITAFSKKEIRQAIRDERFVEFAFEAKRFFDLRRWRIFKSRMESLDGHFRHGLRIEWNGAAKDRPQGLENIEEIASQFTISVIPDVKPVTMLNEDKYSFFAIPLKYIDRNKKLEQTNTWGGTFNPLD